MNKKFQRGIAETALLIWVIAGLAILFIPNPVSNVFGVGVRPNKTIQKQASVEKVELLKDDKGNPIKAEDGTYLIKRTISDQTSDVDSQQRVTLWQSLMALPRLWLLLMILGCFFPILGAIMHRVNQSIIKGARELKTDAKKIVQSVDSGLDKIPDVVIIDGRPVNLKQEVLNAMSKTQDSSTKNLVSTLKRS